MGRGRRAWLQNPTILAASLYARIDHCLKRIFFTVILSWVSSGWFLDSFFLRQTAVFSKRLFFTSFQTEKLKGDNGSSG
jgi:hypothetical protein